MNPTPNTKGRFYKIKKKQFTTNIPRQLSYPSNMPAPKVPKHGNLQFRLARGGHFQPTVLVKKLPNQIHRFDPTFAQHGLNLGSTLANLLPIWAQPGLNLGLTLHRLDPSCWEDLWPKLCSTRAQNEEHGIPNTKR